MSNGVDFPTAMERLLQAGKERKAAGQTFKWSRDYLRDEEALTIISAGTDTTGISTMVILYNVVRDKAIQARLLAELRSAVPKPNGRAAFTVLEKLPYLTAVIKEGLRYASPAASRTPRLVPKGGTTLSDGRFIPEGTRVGMVIYHIHYNPDIFPEPRKFRRSCPSRKHCRPVPS
jgi:cytochrome P450